MPSLYGFEYTCYESDVAWFAPGIAEKMIETYIEMLKEMKGELLYRVIMIGYKLLLLPLLSVLRQRVLMLF